MPIIDQTHNLFDASCCLVCCEGEPLVVFRDPEGARSWIVKRCNPENTYKLVSLLFVSDPALLPSESK
jgi:hypothetical protein